MCAHPKCEGQRITSGVGPQVPLTLHLRQSLYGSEALPCRPG